MNRSRRKTDKVISNDNLKNALLNLKSENKIEVKPVKLKQQPNQGKKNRTFRDLSGVVLLDKPKDVSSNFILQKIKRLFNVKKAGHTGSLDPIATGLLPICFGKTTKYAQFLLDSDKCYEVVAKFGVVTTTCDIEGEVVSEKEVPNNFSELLESIVPTFMGKQQQVPPMYSALKHQGKPLYAYAREGIEIKREARDINIYDLKILNIDTENKTARLFVSCTKGTYIRSLVHDIGEKLGVGGHVQELRRVSIGNIGSTEMVSIEDLEKAFENGGFKSLEQYRKSVPELMHHLPYIFVSSNDILPLKQGKNISNELIEQNVLKFAPNQKIRLYLESMNNFIGVGLVNSDKKISALAIG